MAEASTVGIEALFDVADFIEGYEDAESYFEHHGYDQTLRSWQMVREPGSYRAGWGAYLSTRSQWCERGVLPLCYKHNGHGGVCTNSGLGVGHVWTNALCPAYTTAEPSDCTCGAS